MTFSSPIDLRLPITPETDDPKLFSELFKVYNAIKNLQIGATQLTGAVQPDRDLWPQIQLGSSVLIQNMNRAYYMAGEAIAQGEIVAIYAAGGGVTKIRKAKAGHVMTYHLDGFGGQVPNYDETPTYYGVGYCSAPGGVALGEFSEVILLQGILQITGVVPGVTYYLGSTPGTIVAATSTSYVVQSLGHGIGTNLLYFRASFP